MQEITPPALHDRIVAGEPLVILDVREAVEVAQGMLPGAIHIPLAALPERLEELSKDSSIIAYCHHGARSARAVQYLEAAGYADATNLLGGIDAWSEKIDSSLPRY